MIKQMPNSEEAERGLLGSAMLEPSRVLGDVVVRLGITHDSFYNNHYSTLFRLLHAMHQRDRTIDIVTVGTMLEKAGKLGQIGGYEALTALMDDTPTSAHAEYYAEIVAEKKTGREVIAGASDAIDRIIGGENPMECAARAVTALDKIVTNVSTSRTIEEVNKGIEDGWDKVGIKSKFEGFKDMFRYDGMVVVGAYPSVGKTALVVNETIMWSSAGVHVAGASLEMSEYKIRERMAASYAGVNTSNLYRGDQTARQKVRDALKEIGRWNMTINDSGMTCDSFCAWCRAMKARGAKVIWLDYLQLFNCTGDEWKMPVEQRISMWSNKIKATQKSIDIPIIVLSQLSRPFTRDTSTMPPPPTLSSLRYSGSIEQDADAVLLLYKNPDEDPSYYLHNSTWPEVIDLAKQRNGETGRIEIWFERELQRLRDKSDVFVKEVVIPKEKEQTFEW
jgi:replicative DNA helicase